ncbi:hypothetical protein OH807_07925 [Kitasatospora sp. NBC_01560]|uniref:hypothetical protein n=1 Tax=Kitasatospora sp. NBC_01560 TaxID=2975965 RepID=UPI00386BE8FD
MTRPPRALPSAVLGLLLAGTAAGCSGGPSGAPAKGVNPASAKVRTDVEPLQRRFLAIGQLSDPRWVGYDKDDDGGRVTVPDPDPQVRVAGLAHLPVGTAATLTADPAYAFHPGTPGDLPPALDGDLVRAAHWLTSPAYDRSITKSQYVGTFYLDPATDLLWFDTISPSIADGSTPS